MAPSYGLNCLDKSVTELLFFYALAEQFVVVEDMEQSLEAHLRSVNLSWDDFFLHFLVVDEADILDQGSRRVTLEGYEMDPGWNDVALLSLKMVLRLRFGI